MPLPPYVELSLGYEPGREPEFENFIRPEYDRAGFACQDYPDYPNWTSGTLF